MFVFFFNDTATTEIYTLSLHDALPILAKLPEGLRTQLGATAADGAELSGGEWQRLAVARAFMRELPLLFVLDRKSTRLNSSHANISYAVFCLKKKKKKLYDMISSRFLI